MAVSDWTKKAGAGKRKLPGADQGFAADFSGYDIPGTSCANCRSLSKKDGDNVCGNPTYVGKAVPGKAAGENVIPVASGDASKYCCNVWQLSPDKA